MATRADSLTVNKKRSEFFSDFLNGFDKTPVGNQIARVTNEQAVNQSLRNLIKTNLGERMFQPGVGGHVYASLFEPNDQLLINKLKRTIELTIKANEKRANVIQVQVVSLVNEGQLVNQGVALNENFVQVVIVYTLINNPDLITLSVILKRVR